MNPNKYKNNSTAIGYISALVAAMLFGSVSTMGKAALATIDPLLLSSLVYLISAATLTPLAHRAKFTFKKKDYLIVLATAVSGAAIAPSMYFFGLELTTATDTALLANGEIAFSILLAMLFFKERLNLIGYLAVTMVLVGIIIVTTDIPFSSSIPVINLGNFLVILATVFWAIDNNLSKNITYRVDVARLAQLKSLIGGSILLLIVFLMGISINIDAMQLLHIFILGSVGFAASLYFFLQSLKRIGTVRTVLMFSMSSVFGLIFAILFLKEDIKIYQIGAIAIMISGIYLMTRE